MKWHLHEDCRNSNASYFITLTHNVRGRGWWYGSGGWTFLSIFHFVAVQQMAAEGQTDNLEPNTEVHLKQRCITEFFPCRKNCTHWHSSVLAERLWRPNSRCEHSKVVGGVFQHWQQRQWVTSAGADFYEHSMKALVHHCQKWITNGDDYVEKYCLVA